MRPRVIPVLLLKDRGVVKTEQFANHKYISDPINALHLFNEMEVDEVIVVDIECSKKQKEPDYEYIQMLASECFMPICYGGGVRTIEQMARLFKSGIEKIA